MFKQSTLTVMTAALVVSACVGGGTPRRDQPDFKANTSTPLAAIGVNSMEEATQNWTDGFRLGFWHKDQGSLMAPLDIAMNIERAKSETLMLSDESVVQYRYVPQNQNDKFNKYGLPLGFAASEGPYTKLGRAPETYIGLTCAACHSTIITYKGAGLMIDGAPSLGNFQEFFKDFTLAFRETVVDQDKMDRLAKRMGLDTATARSVLRKRVELATEDLEARREMNRTSSDYGYGRVDAIGQIFNAVSLQNLGFERTAKSEPNAPVSYPHIWGSHQSDFVQWNGFAPNVTRSKNVRILGPLVRNAGEVIGVFGEVQVTPPPPIRKAGPIKTRSKKTI